jgi:regulator of replication initiation timing
MTEGIMSILRTQARTGDALAIDAIASLNRMMSDMAHLQEEANRLARRNTMLVIEVEELRARLDYKVTG